MGIWETNRAFPGLVLDSVGSEAGPRISEPLAPRLRSETHKSSSRRLGLRILEPSREIGWDLQGIWESGIPRRTLRFAGAMTQGPDLRERLGSSDQAAPACPLASGVTVSPSGVVGARLAR